MSQPRSALAGGLALLLAGSMLNAGVAHGAVGRDVKPVSAWTARHGAKPRAPAATPSPAAPPATPPAAGAPAPGRMRLTVLRAGGSSPFAIAPGRIVVQGLVIP